MQRLYIEEGTAIAKELYLSCLVDRETSTVAFIASTEGGVNIEEVAAKTPDKIATIHVDPASGYAPFVGRRIAAALKLEGDQVKQCVKMMGQLYKAFTEKDMSLLEINPLVITKDGQLVCLDAKMNFDDNALDRHPDIKAYRDLSEEDPKEIEASKYDLSYVALDGSIGCMVNGAGLAMATMDIIKLYGMEPANFLDVGGGATKEKVTAAFKIITADPARQGHPGQHLRRHHEMRHHRRRRDRRREGSGPAGSPRGAPRRHQCRSRQEDHQGLAAQRHLRRQPRRCRQEDRQSGEGSLMAIVNQIFRPIARLNPKHSPSPIIRNVEE